MYFCANLLKLIFLNELTKKEALPIENYNYHLPDARIAKYPLAERDSSKLLLYKDHKIGETIFKNIVDYLPEGCLLVCNNTRVIHARLVFRKPTGGRIEVFCLEPADPSDYVLSLSSTTGCEWECMVGNLKKWKEPILTTCLLINDETVCLTAERISSEENTHRIRFTWDNSAYSFSEILEQAGELPIPPYLNRDTEESDEVTYQTVFSRIEGSVAAPTAGLHFTDAVLKKLEEKNIRKEELTLHVGAGTFRPVKSDDVANHVMHTETIVVTLKVLEKIHECIDNIVAVGTTSVRTLESLYYIGVRLAASESVQQTFFHVNQWEPYEENLVEMPAGEALQYIIDYMKKNGMESLHAETQILIKPGFKYRIVKSIITNFHQPKSTLLLLVSAFVGEDWKKIYDYALTHDFRFLSYGDSSLLMR